MRRGYQAYSRQLYFQSYSQWHKHVYQSERRVQLDNTTTRPFPVPSTLSAGKRGADLGTFDIVFVSDFYVSAKDSKTVLANLDAAAQAWFRTGFMLWNLPVHRHASGYIQEYLSFSILERFSKYHMMIMQKYGY